MDSSCHPQLHLPSYLTRAEVAAAECESLSIGPADTAQVKALGRYELSAPLEAYDQKDLVFVPNAVRRYVPAGLFWSLYGDDGSDAASVLQEMQGGREEVSCVECGLVKTFVIPEKAKKVVVIKDENGEVVRAGKTTDGRTGGERAPGAEISTHGVGMQQASTVNMPTRLASQPTTGRTFNPEAVAFDFTPSIAQFDTGSSATEEPNAASDADDGQAFYPAPYDYIRSASRCTVERWSLSTATTVTDSEGWKYEWHTIGISSSDCERCRLVATGIEVFVQARKKNVVGETVGWEEHDTGGKIPVRSICGRCLDSEELERNLREQGE